MEFNHIPIMLDECIEHLKINPTGTYIDGTLGGAGHGQAICSRLEEKGHFIGIDQDENAIHIATERLIGQRPQISIVRDNFRNIKQILNSLKIDEIDGMLLDLGVSSHQLDEPERGFSYQHDAPLDMRMDNRQSLSAEYIVNNYSQDELTRIIKEYGEENWANRIAKFIIDYRKNRTIHTTGELVEIIKNAIPAKARRTGGHPAKRTFQALRIEVNNELGILENTIRDILEHLIPGGRLCIITFHSLEDRIVKKVYKHFENPCTCPPEFPQCICNQKSLVKVITRKPIIPQAQEIKDNPRSRSAKLRVLERNSSK
ncbi:16S rRNA (cytosine(1402)-N(4))-methyltransferase RsmH [Irregularibacter muris]|uniref:Ribosomal RNA small subunit methyltransferase H n=1 Tax=Irregularibacter muris TaxID=1796619 RepID=A0AAE3HG80_9FIRM|nr:16S rRNA (cytosine(1402)-N(4))-methyltransferase RsmH [Irregularibacter muris]MCR1898013.1 16S rRNA (cytosine(1402)-N(4))-methyltransferase RsmH [Irregularibacter muris]